MLDLISLGNAVLQQVPLLNIKIEDIRIAIEPSDYFPLPVIRIDARLDIRLGF